MINLTEEQLKKLQLIQLELLKEAHRICTKNDIKYNIIAGTLLGAVRHGGYIPWDDDADIALLREEYEKFRQVCKTDLDHSKFYFQDHTTTQGYRWGYGKLRAKNTLFLREFQEHLPYDQGVFIDIFPLDNVPENKIIRNVHNLYCYCIRKTMWSPVGMLAHKSQFKRLWFRLLYLMTKDNVFKHYNKFIIKTNKKESEWVRILTFPTPNNKWGYLKKWYENSSPIYFEGIQFIGISNYDEYLSFKFGDYMELPPINQRKTHPVTDILLEFEVSNI